MENAPPSSSPGHGSFFSSGFTRCYGFLTETKSRLLQAFVKPRQSFPHTPSMIQTGNGEGVQSLNHPFQPITPSENYYDPAGGVGSSSITQSADDVSMEALERNISDLEFAVKNIMGEGEGGGEVDSSNTVTSAEMTEDMITSDPSHPVPYEEMHNLFSTSSTWKDKLPPGIYQEIIAIYQSQLNSHQDKSCGGDMIQCECDVPSDSPLVDLKKPSSQNKERNLRREVLKWEKVKDEE